MTDPLFHKVDELYAILNSKGVYRQADVYSKLVDGKRCLFAKSGSGFVMLLGNKGTSSPNISYIELVNLPGFPVLRTETGRPYLPEPDTGKVIDFTKAA